MAAPTPPLLFVPEPRGTGPDLRPMLKAMGAIRAPADPPRQAQKGRA